MMSSDQTKFEGILSTILAASRVDTDLVGYIASLLFEAHENQDDTHCREFMVEILTSASPEETDIPTLVDAIWNRFEAVVTNSGITVGTINEAFSDTDLKPASGEETQAPQGHDIDDAEQTKTVTQVSDTDATQPTTIHHDVPTSASTGAKEYTEPRNVDWDPDCHVEEILTSKDDFDTESRMTELAQLLQSFTEEEMTTLRSLNDKELGTALWMLVGDESATAGSNYDASGRAGSHVYGEPCKYFLQGACFRSDCRYLHQVSNIPCKFYLNGWCQNGTECPFLHDDSNTWVVTQAIQMIKDGSWDGIAEELILARKNTLAEYSPNFDCRDMFPTLGAPTNREPGAQWSANMSTDGNIDNVTYDGSMADRIKLVSLQKMFPVVWDSDIQRHLRDASSNLEFAVSSLKEEYPGAYVHPAPEHAAPSANMSGPTSYRTRRRKGTTPVQDVQWVRTGVVLGVEYDAYRADAIKHAEARNRYFQEARAAFVRGDKQGAKELSRKGRYHDACMREQHALAAENLFRSRNSGSASNRRNPDNVVDLHGLHVDEALAYLEHTLETLSQPTRLAQAHGQQYRYCYVVTGTGHHSSHKVRSTSGIAFIWRIPSAL